MSERRRKTITVAGPGNYEAKGGATKSEIERRLSEQPAVIRDTARVLSREFKSQANELRQQRPNDPDRIAQQDNFLFLTVNIAIGLDNLADNLDQAITKATNDEPEPVFVSKAAEAVQRLHFGFTGWLKENGTAVFDVSYRIGIFLVGVVFLHSLGADSMTAIGALGILARNTASKKKSTAKRRGKK